MCILTHLAYTFQVGEQGWRSSESAFLPPLWPVFDSRTWSLMLVDFVFVSRPCSEGYFLRNLRFSSFLKNQHAKFQLGLDTRMPLKRVSLLFGITWVNRITVFLQSASIFSSLTILWLVLRSILFLFTFSMFLCLIKLIFFGLLTLKVIC